MMTEAEVGWMEIFWLGQRGREAGWHTNEAQLGELQDHPVLRGLLEGEVLHGAQVVGLGYDVILQLHSGG